MPSDKPKKQAVQIHIQRDPAGPRHVMAVRGKEPNPELVRCMRCQAITRTGSRYCKRHEPAPRTP